MGAPAICLVHASPWEADGFPFPRELSPGRQRHGNGSGVVNRVVSRAYRKERAGPVLSGLHGTSRRGVVRTDRPNGSTGAPRPRAYELSFIDPSMSDLGTIFRNGRPESEAIMSGAARPGMRQPERSERTSSMGCCTQYGADAASLFGRERSAANGN
jgi:hypothetical protein